MKEILLFGWESDLTIDFEIVKDTPPKYAARHVVTALAPELSPTDLALNRRGDRAKRREHRPNSSVESLSSLEL